MKRKYLIEGLLVCSIRFRREDDMAGVDVADFHVMLHSNLVNGLALAGSHAKRLACPKPES